MFKLSKSFIYDKKENGEPIDKVIAYQINLTDDKPLHLRMTLGQGMDCNAKPSNNWTVFVNLTQYPNMPGKHYGSISKQFTHPQGSEVFSIFSKIYENSFTKRFQNVLNEKYIERCLRVAIELQDMGFDFDI